MSDASKRKISIYVPQPARVVATLPVDEAETHALTKTIGEVIGKVSTVPASSVQGQWNDTIDTLVDLGSTISQRAQAFKIDEIEVGLTLSAKGELLFIAEAGAEASIKVILKPK
jgi:hypothetical protein